MSYLYFCGAAISGPWYEYKDFKQMIAKEGEWKEIPSPIKAGLTRFMQAWMCVASGALLAQYFDEKFTLTEEFLSEYSLLQKWIYLYFVLKLVM